MKLAEVSSPPTCMIIGRGGSGKTHFIGTLLRKVPDTLVVTSDLPGLDTLKHMDGIDPTKGEVLHIQDWRNIWQVYLQIEKAVTDYRCLAVDNANFLQRLQKDMIVSSPRSAESRKQQQSDPARYAEGVLLRQFLGDGQPKDQRQWGQLMGFEAWLLACRRLPFQFQIWTFHEAARDDSRSGKEHFFPALEGQTRLTLGGHFSLVGELLREPVEEKTRFCLSTLARANTEAKTRYGPGRVWLEPSALDVFEYCLEPEKYRQMTKLEVTIAESLMTQPKPQAS